MPQEGVLAHRTSPEREKEQEEAGQALLGKQKPEPNTALVAAS